MRDPRAPDFDDHECIVCGRVCPGRRSLGNHLNRTHRMSIQEYVLHHMLDDIVPKCLCGCGNDVSWHKTLYRFNSYLSGHNEGGFSSTNQPDWTPEMVDRRNDSIRRTYDKKGDQIKQRISSSLKKTLNEPGMGKRLSEAQRAGWKRPGVKERVSKIRKRVWRERHDELYDKIFTVEMRRKISNANLRRGMNKTSKAERAFKADLRERLGSSVAVRGRWVSMGGMNKHFDVFLRDQGVLVEFDGLYWHGLDRSEAFTRDQLHNMTNDMVKNRMAALAGLELIRIAEGTDISGVSTYDDLCGIANHHQLADGTVIRDGMFRFMHDDQSILTRDQLIRMNEKEIFSDAPGRAYTEAVLKPTVMCFLREYVTTRGWFYPHSQGSVDDVITSLRNRHVDTASRRISSLGTIGSDFLRSRFNSYWDVVDGPVNSFWDDKRLDRVVSYRLGLNESRLYDYVLDDGRHVSCHETFSISPKNIRRGFIVQRNAVSWFKPTAAFEVYRRLIPHDRLPVVWDPSCGFGARLLGFAAACSGGTYIGTEPATSTFRDLRSLAVELGDRVDCRLFNERSEAFDPGYELDLVFTSPPYFDKEKYCDEGSQCWKMYPTLDAWTNDYLRPTLTIAAVRLRQQGSLVINIDRRCESIVRSIALSLGLIECDGFELMIGRDHFSRGRSDEMNVEPILIFNKP